MDLVSVRVPTVYIEALDELVLKGRYACRSEAMRIAIRDYLRALGNVGVYSPGKKIEVSQSSHFTNRD